MFALKESKSFIIILRELKLRHASHCWRINLLNALVGAYEMLLWIAFDLDLDRWTFVFHINVNYHILLAFFSKRKVYQMLQSVCIWWESSIYQSLLRLVYLVQVSTRHRNERLGSINRGMLPKMRSVISCASLFKGMQRIIKKPVQVCTCTCNPFLKWSSSMDTYLLLVLHFHTRVYIYS